MEDDRERDLWMEYARTRSVAVRNEIATMYSYIPKKVAAKVSNRIRLLETGDLESEGFIGLLDAIPRFDYERGVKFKTFAYRRVMGAVLDHLRELDHLSRNSRVIIRDRDRRRDDFIRENCCAPNSQDLDGDNAYHYLCSTPISISRKVVSDSKDVTVAELITDKRFPAPGSRIEAWDEVRRILRGLKKDVRIVVIYYYLLDMTMKDIGRSMGMSESRVSQIHTKAIAYIRERLECTSRAVGT